MITFMIILMVTYRVVDKKAWKAPVLHCAAVTPYNNNVLIAL